MQFLKHSLIVAGACGVIVGILMVVVLAKTDQWTSSDEFCGSSCHAMQAYIANEPVYLNSSHRTTSTGIQAGCGDCHIPKNLIAATWTHISAGIRDSYSSLVNDFSTRDAWNDKRAAMAYSVRDWMLDNDSVTCLSCHQQGASYPRRERGKRQHELALRQNVSCIGCHFNIVHEPVRPRESFLDRVQIKSVDNSLSMTARGLP